MENGHDMKLREIQIRYGDKAKGRPGPMFLLPPEDAISYIDECVAQGYRLLGVEGFFVTRGYRPSMEHSNDIGDTDLEQSDFVEETKAFIRERASIPSIHFEIVFDVDTGGSWVGEPPWAS